MSATETVEIPAAAEAASGKPRVCRACREKKAAEASETPAAAEAATETPAAAETAPAAETAAEPSKVGRVVRAAAPVAAGVVVGVAAAILWPLGVDMFAPKPWYAFWK